MQKLSEKKKQEEDKKKEEQERKERIKREAREKVKDIMQNVERSERKNAAGDDTFDRHEEEEKKPPPPPKKRDTEGFLERNKPKGKVFLPISDMATWKKKNRVDEKTKVFIVMGGYGDLKRALKRRGWVENKDHSSPCFDLKWTLKGKDLDHSQLTDGQIVNHFTKNAAITTKAGLCHNLKNLIWFNNIDIDTFFPRAFDLADPGELEDFKEEFKAVKAESILKRYAHLGEDIDELKVRVALAVCERRLKDLDDFIDDPNAILCVQEHEWEILADDELNESRLA